MSDFTTARQELGASIEGIGYLVYSYPTETMQVPSIVLVPDSPYLEVETLSRRVFAQNFKATLMVAYVDNQSSLINLEDLIGKFLDVLPKSVQIVSISQPAVTQVGPSNVLAVDAKITIHLVKE